ncbi:hypothetical protein HQN90_20305 [Paenibacillus alba]|uniref:hypothetical protein n=1 Tax=Paenibacillus alba TaxID=1197127 RepID=UPI001565265C|nr:hypothetical protein [Paenibacillus alba]NQX68471.1 hypothetical protein [Paenibacillus alba]
MKENSVDKFDSAASLHVLAKIVEYGQLSPKQANEAIEVLVGFYGAGSEEQILNCGDNELVRMYKEIKQQILERVC